MSTSPASTVEEQRDDEEWLAPPPPNRVPVGEIEEGGLGAIDDLLRHGPVHVVVDDHPGYVIMSEALFDEWLDDRHEAYVARVQAALAEVEAGNVQRYDSAEELMAAIDRYQDPDEE